IYTWDITSGNLLRRLGPHEGEVECLAFSPDGQCVASGAVRTVYCWDAKTGALRRRLAPLLRQLHALAFSPDSRMLAAGGKGVPTREGRRISITGIWVYDANAGQVLNHLEGPGGIQGTQCLSYSPDGTMLASGGDSVVSLWDTK